MATDRAATLAALRARLARIQGGGRTADAVPVAKPVDAALPGGKGLPRGASHEVAATEGDSGSAFGFAAMLAARACAGPDPQTTFWIEPEPSIWPAGALRFGHAAGDPGGGGCKWRGQPLGRGRGITMSCRRGCLSGSPEAARSAGLAPPATGRRGGWRDRPRAGAARGAGPTLGGAHAMAHHQCAWDGCAGLRSGPSGLAA